MPSEPKLKIASHLLMGMFFLTILLYGLLPGLIAACVGVLLTKSFTKTSKKQVFKLPSHGAAAVVIAAPLVLLVLLLVNAKGMAMGAVSQYSALLKHLAETVLELRDKLPASIAGAIPDEIATVQTWLSGYLKSQASSLSHVGQSWLHGVLFAYVGLVIGALVSASHKEDKPIALRKQMRNRGQTLIDTFRQIIVAQLWIASFNATCTAVFLLAVLPAFGTHMPYASTLVLFTFLSSLIPVVGNLVCNSVLALTGVSVSPMVGLACLGFLMLIHKAEYIILSRTVGSRTNTATWELLAVLFIGEAVFGMAGLIAAPLMYAYVKKELQAERLV